MNRLSIFLLACLLALHTTVPTAAAQNTGNSTTCTQVLHTEMAQLHRIFRAVLFGHREAASAPIGYVTHEQDGSNWYKVSEDAWRSASDGYTRTTHHNSLVDDLSEITAAFGKPDRRGIFETRNVTTSELIPHIGVSLRAFQCQLYQFCEAVSMSKEIKEEAAQPITVQYPGCQPIERTSIQQCHINENRPTVESNIIYHNCETAVRSLLTHEAEVVNLAVQYDAAYRTLLQLSGGIDLFLQEIHWSMKGTLRDATDLISILGRIPCFVASCEAFPPPK